MERLLNIEELSQILNVKKSTIYDWAHKDFIPCHRLGKLIRFKEIEIIKWLNERRSFGRLNRVPSIVLKRKNK